MDNAFIVGKMMELVHLSLHHFPCRVCVSFPDSQGSDIGGIVRLHGSEDELKLVLGGGVEDGLEDYFSFSGILGVPSDIKGYRNVRRVQPKSSPARIRRRLVRRHNISEEEAIRRWPDSRRQMLDLPFFLINSRSTGQSNIRFFVEHSDFRPEQTDGHVSSYGLSREMTVPVW
ncbi:hypothetical protein A0U91_16910 (plasmid) [Acetobacter persici]|uniref:Uncharacterized protein n=2 Tax=Acetobacter persici TaxID=1076596 RepID=A0A1U9LJP9_9PROT|nr:hypothetical protein A0U91_16910 [Acetobacter persici]